jgi:hypothetical protein
VPVTPVALACAAIQSFDSDFIPRARLLERMEEMRDALVELNSRVVRADRDVGETFDRAWRMLRMRRILAQSETDTRFYRADARSSATTRTRSRICSAHSRLLSDGVTHCHQMSFRAERGTRSLATADPSRRSG